MPAATPAPASIHTAGLHAIRAGLHAIAALLSVMLACPAHTIFTCAVLAAIVLQGVAAIVARKVEEDAANGVSDALKLKGHVDRKLVKQTVMTSVYGVTAIGARAQVGCAKCTAWQHDMIWCRTCRTDVGSDLICCRTCRVGMKDAGMLSAPTCRYITFHVSSALPCPS